jgi:hypothetical protein
MIIYSQVNKPVLRRPVESGLTAAIGVEDRVGLDVPVAVCHLERLDAQLCVRAVAELPADDHLGREVDHDREVGPAGPGTDVGDVAHQLRPGLLACELTADQVGRGLRFWVLSRGDAVGLGLRAGEVLLA